MKAQIDLPKVVVDREDIGDSEFLHDHQRGEIDKRNVRLDVVALPHDPGTVELLRSDVNELVCARVHGIEDRVYVTAGLSRRMVAIEMSSPRTKSVVMY